MILKDFHRGHDRISHLDSKNLLCLCDLYLGVFSPLRVKVGCRHYDILPPVYFCIHLLKIAISSTQSEHHYDPGNYRAKLPAPNTPEIQWLDRQKVTVVGIPVQKVLEGKIESLFSNAQPPNTGAERVPLSFPIQ